MEGMAGALVGLVGAGLQAQAQHDQLMFQYAQFNWQKQRALQQDWFAQASRSDMYGNVTRYDRGLNKWVVDLTPDQQAIRDAGQKEQLLQLTKDAPAARKIRQAVQQRAYEAKEPFERAKAGYQYDQPPSEEAIRSKLTTLMAVNDMMKSKADQALIMRQAMRMGGTAHPQEIIQVTNQQLGDADRVKNRMLEARKMALQEYGQRQQQHEAKWGTPMKVWGEYMQQGGDLPNIGKSNMDQSINSMINSQASAMQNAFNQGTQGVSAALSGLASAAGKSPDLSSVASALSKMKFGQQKGTGQPNDPYNPTTTSGATFSDTSGGFDPNRNWYGYSDTSEYF